MCCFSAPVEHVARTNIFARPTAGGRQLLVYSMNFASARDVAMVLPLPVPLDAPEDAVRFINLDGYSALFSDMARAFPTVLASPGRSGMLAPAQAPRRRLEVHAVGAFEASYVPTRADFDRLDARFRLPESAWEQLPLYGDWGFAVFKLARRPASVWSRLFGRRGPRRQTVHPMAFEFPRRDPDALFFPTLHIHDGQVHERADFDHTLYCQPDALTAATIPWERSRAPLGEHVDTRRAGELIDGARPCFRAVLTGSLPNRDQVLRPPRCADVSRLRHRGPSFELRARAHAAYWTTGRASQRSGQLSRSETSRRHLDRVITQLTARVTTALADHHDALGLTAYDDALHPYQHNNGKLWSAAILREDGVPATPRAGEPLVVVLRVQDSRVEPQEVRVAFASPPDAVTLANTQRALDEALAGVELP